MGSFLCFHQPNTWSFHFEYGTASFKNDNTMEYEWQQFLSLDVQGIILRVRRVKYCSKRFLLNDTVTKLLDLANWKSLAILVITMNCISHPVESIIKRK